MDKQLMEKLKKIKLLALDCDGVLTDCKISSDNSGNESARFSKRDSLGIKILIAVGVQVIVISGEKSAYVSERCRKLGIGCANGVTDKRQALVKMLCTKMILRDIGPEEICFVGDDLNDIGVMEYVGAPIAVADAVPEIKMIATYITARKGGDHAVREICDLILGAKKEVIK